MTFPLNCNIENPVFFQNFFRFFKIFQIFFRKIKSIFLYIFSALKSFRFLIFFLIFFRIFFNFFLKKLWFLPNGRSSGVLSPPRSFSVV